MKAEMPFSHQEAFGQLYRLTHINIYRYIFGLWGGSAEEIEDFTAEVFLRAWDKRDQFSGNQTQAVYWLFRIARNLVIDNYRRQKNSPISLPVESMDSLFPSPSIDNSPENMAIRRQQILKMWSMCMELDSEMREIIVLRYMLDWKVKDIAVYLNLEENTVSQKIRRTLLRLQSNWMEE